jgi:bifunctional UDP-N-acetylglucosamine pyrophosphorylase/glucosamine-1-phosphate N-acetyltransferase
VLLASVKSGDRWEILGVNSKEQLAELERVYQRRRAAQLMDAGVTVADPARLDVRGSLVCGADVRIDVNCLFEGEVKLGDRVEIGAHCVIRNAEIAAGARIEPFTHIDSARVGVNCRVGPYARLRPGARLQEEVHIGNFVEVKESDIGARSKANHLAYVGDATVGRDVNIGAGTITCNYDGANKHRTVIEDEVHIGSDVQLVAPVTVGKGATVGAGTTVWKNAAPGELTVNEKTQVTKAGWKRPQKKKAVTGDS